MAEKAKLQKLEKAQSSRALKPPTPSGAQIERQPVLAPYPDIVSRMGLDPLGIGPSEINVLQRTLGMRTTGRLAAQALNQLPVQRLPVSVNRNATSASLQRMLAKRGISIQPKLTVGAADDPYEREAERVASQVMSMSTTAPAGISRKEDDAGATTTAQRKPAFTPLVQRNSRDFGLAGSFDAGHDVERQIAANRSGGNPLPDRLRSDLEPRFGADFSNVRVHTGAQSDSLNRSIGAQAFTHSNHIYMAAGKYNPGTSGGKHLLAHELTHVVQQGGAGHSKVQRTKGNRAGADMISRQRRAPGVAHGKLAAQPVGSIMQRRSAVIQRVPWTTDHLIDTLDTIPFLKGKLDMDNVRNEVMRDRVRAIVNKYGELFKGKHRTSTNNAMMLSIALENVARVIAEELASPDIQPTIQQKLMELYKSDIGEKFAGSKDMTRTMKLAEALMTDNPVARYMHREMRVEEAAKKVQDMAGAAGDVKALKMFSLLREKFLAELASYTKTKLKQTEDKREAYNVKETPGELSESYFTKLFGAVENAPIVDNKVQLTPEATDRLTKLRTHVASDPSTWKFQLGKRGDELYQQHLGKIKDEEKELVKQAETDPKTILVNYLKKNYGLDDPKANTAYQNIEQFAQDMPLTITVPGTDWFGQTEQVTKKNMFGFKSNKTQNKLPDPKFRPATRQGNMKKVSELFGKDDAQGDIEYTGKYTNPNFVKDRGEGYLRFRKWKDTQMTNRLGFEAGEMPSFGAANVNWNLNRGTETATKESIDKWNIQKDKKGNFEAHGINYYGEVHFLIKRANVANRMVYTATDHGRPRHNPIFAIADFASGERLTKNKQGPNTKMLAAIVNAAIVGENLQVGLPLEIQIFGGFDITHDVEKIYVAPAASKTVLAGISKFSKKYGVPYEKMKAPKKGNPVQIMGAQINKLKVDLNNAL